MLYYHILDWFFIIFHTVLIFFNVFGWIYKPLRKWNFLTLSLTAVSWFVLGIFYGMGYCFLTDWHWTILDKLEKIPSESSYIQYLFRRLLNIRINVNFADTLTVTVFFMAFFCSGVVNFSDLIKKKRNKN